ncbi:hypothetical protein NC651_024841 [Populus alba x Populus x berolinensis]|nr:hypothetical protein NC651_024841 [Populus alba x Populus x berolinensis]
MAWATGPSAYEWPDSEVILIFLPQSSVQVLKLPNVNDNCVTKPLSGCEVSCDIIAIAC